jgi:radical SAM superfamily enzyme YgiQ (UPF0313 family)
VAARGGRARGAPGALALARSRTIVLLYPRAEPDWPLASKPLGLPLAPLTVARTLVREGYDVRIVDENAVLDVRAALRAIPMPSFVGISCIGGGQLRHGMRLAELARRVWPAVPRVWGGWNPTLLPHLYERADARRWVDLVVRGRGEAAALALARALERGVEPAEIPGVSWLDPSGARDGGELRRGADAPFEDPHDAELLPYHLVPDVSRTIVARGMLNYVSSYGCPHRCSFCGIPAGTKTFRAIDPQRVADQLAVLRERMELSEVLFLDDNFFTQRPRVLALAEAMLERRTALRWHSNGRIEQVDALTDSELALLVRSGCSSLNLGYETGDQHVADLVRKDTRVDRMPALAARLREAGIGASINFMVGLPGETEESLFNSLDSLFAVHAAHPGIEVCWYIYMPAPGTESWRELVAAGRLTEPRTLREHARLQPYGLEHPWYYASPPADVWREWRTPHKQIAWRFWVAWAAHLPSRGPRAKLLGWLREYCRRRHAARRRGEPLAWRAAYAMHRARTLVGWGLANAGRQAWCAPLAERSKSRAFRRGAGGPALPVGGVHRGT